MNHIGLFEGIGGFSLAARWMGWHTLAWCEINPFCQTVLKHHFPNAAAHSDIRTTDFSIYRGQCDIITGGFPCQPYSQAGKRLGKADDRHLWPEMLRTIQSVQPTWVVGENVLGITNWNGGVVFDEVQADLEASGYEVQPYILPACAVNAPHRRDRVWFVAYRSCKSGQSKATEWQEYIEGRQKVWDNYNTNGKQQITPNPNRNGQYRGNSEHEKYTSERGQHVLNDAKQVDTTNGSVERLEGEDWTQTAIRFEQGNSKGNWLNFPTQPPLCGGNDGLPTRLVGITFPMWRKESIKAYGNAIVWQVAYEIFKIISAMNKSPA